MENSYGIGVANKYSVFLDDDEGVDPFEALEKVAKQERDDKKVKASGKENKNTSKATSSKTLRNIPAREGNGVSEKDSSPAGSGPAGGRGQAPRRGGFAAGENRGDGFNSKRFYDDRPDFREGGAGAAPRFGGEVGAERGRGRGRGRGGERGRGRGRGSFGGVDSRGKREFDRQSGSDRSGVKPVDKRDGAGRGNWGTVQDDLAELDPATHEVPPAAEPDPEPEAGDDPESAAETGPREMTLDEWRQQQQPRSQPAFNVRRAGEGENSTQWKGAYQLKKKRNEDGESDEEDESDEEEEEHVRHGRPKNLVKDIQFTFSDSRRGGRGPGRGGRGDGGFRGGFRGRARGTEDGFRGGFRGRGRGAEDGFRGGSRDAGDEAPFRGGGGGGSFREGRGGGGRGSDRGAPPPPRQHAPKMDDEHDFPSLG